MVYFHQTGQRLKSKIGSTTLSEQLINALGEALCLNFMIFGITFFASEECTM